MIGNFDQDGSESRLLQIGLGGTAIDLDAFLGIDRDGEEDVSVDQLLQAIAIAGFGRSLEIVDQGGREGVAEVLHSLHHTKQVGAQWLTFDGGGIAREQSEAKEEREAVSIHGVATIVLHGGSQGEHYCGSDLVSCALRALHYGARDFSQIQGATKELVGTND